MVNTDKKKATCTLVLFILTSAVIIFSAGCFEKCPESCDDGNPCTTEYCSNMTGYRCEYVPLNGSYPGCSGRKDNCSEYACSKGRCETFMKLDCCGNRKCETPENYTNCPEDCPNCYTKNPCAIDYFDYAQEKCEQTPILHCVRSTESVAVELILDKGVVRVGDSLYFGLKIYPMKPVPGTVWIKRVRPEGDVPMQRLYARIDAITGAGPIRGYDYRDLAYTPPESGDYVVLAEVGDLIMRVPFKVVY